MQLKKNPGFFFSQWGEKKHRSSLVQFQRWCVKWVSRPTPSAVPARLNTAGRERCGWLDRNCAQEWANTSGTWWSQVIDRDHALVLSDYCLITGILKAWVLRLGISHPAEMEPQSVGGLC